MEFRTSRLHNFNPPYRPAPSRNITFSFLDISPVRLVPSRPRAMFLSPRYSGTWISSESSLYKWFFVIILCNSFFEREWNSRWAYWRKINRIDQKFHLSIPFCSSCTKAHSNKTHPDICRVRHFEPLISVVSIPLSHMKPLGLLHCLPKPLTTIHPEALLHRL